MMASITHGQGDFTLHIIQQESVSDSELMEALKYAVNVQDKAILLKLIRGCPRSRHVFRGKFVHQQWNWKKSQQSGQSEDGREDGSELCWLFNTLYGEGEKDLALHVAATDSSFSLLGDFCRGEINRFDLKRRKYRYALRKLHESDPQAYCEFVKELFKIPKTSVFERSFLFHNAIRLQEHSLAVELCEHGVSRKNLKFAACWLLLGSGNDYVFDQIISMLASKDGNWLRRHAVRLTMRHFFKEKSYTSLETFIKQFSVCNNKRCTRNVFRKAIAECVRLDCADCFVALCCKQFGFDRYSMHHSERQFGFDRYSMHHSEREDCVLAYSSAVSGRRLHFISKKIAKHRRWYELQLLVDIAIEQQAWDVLLSVSSGLRSLFQNGDLFKVLLYCLDKMLSDQTIWPGMAPGLDQWIRTNYLEVVSTMVDCVHANLQEKWPDSLRTLKQWCVDKGHARLAFLLALATEDWQLVETIVSTQPSLDLHSGLQTGAVVHAVENGAYTAGAAMLKVWPITGVNVRTFFPYCGMGPLAEVCEDQGLVDWALVLNSCDAEYVQDHHGRCHNPVVLNWVLHRAVRDRNWNLTTELLPRCADSRTLKKVLKRAVQNGQFDIAESLISRVDPAFVDPAGDKTLLFFAVACRCTDDVKWDMIEWCIQLGLSTFQRGIQFQEDTSIGDHNCPMLWALGIDFIEIVELLLAGGAITHRRLHEIRQDRDMQRCLRARWVDDRWKEGYRYMLKAAATPSRLVHMARLVVSHNIGSQPGRFERISGLPIPEAMKDLLMFKDILGG